MITRDEYLKALEIVRLYRKQCLEDIGMWNDIASNIDPKSLFREVASGRLSQALKKSDFFAWSDDYTTGEVASLVNNYGIKEIRKYRGFGGKLGLELESIVVRIF